MRTDVHQLNAVSANLPAFQTAPYTEHADSPLTLRLPPVWVYRKYAKDERLFQLENEARSAKRGLWGLSEAHRVPPWEWRRR